MIWLVILKSRVSYTTAETVVWSLVIDKELNTLGAVIVIVVELCCICIFYME